MKRFFTAGLAPLLALNMMAGCTSAAEGVEEFYEFRHEYTKIPIDGAGKGIFLSGNNHSDDLFMGCVKTLEGFAPARTYHFSVSFRLATDVEGGLIGVGGSPGESDTVKCGVTQAAPAALPVESSGTTYYRLNIDAGRQSSGGRDMTVVSDLAKAENSRPGEYEFKAFTAEFDTTANILGEVCLIIGTDSGFEATSSYYLDDISVTWEEAEQPTVTRARAAQMLFNTADRPSADPAKCPFRDVAAEDPCAEAITWAWENGYLGGYGDGLFRPEDPMTVEQALVMIHRFFGRPAADPSVLSRYEGGGQVSAWARDAAAWTLANQVFQPRGAISPQAPITVEELTLCLGQIVVAC